MQKIKRAFVILFCVLIAAAVLLFTIENKQSVELSFLSQSSPALPLALPVLGAFVAGAFFSALTFWFPMSRLRRKNLKLGKKLKESEQQLQTVQTVAKTREVAIA